MSNSSYSEQLQGLSDDYYNCRIDLGEYRARRKALLDELDREINGVLIDDPDTSDEDSLLGKVVGFIKHSNPEKNTE